MKGELFERYFPHKSFQEFEQELDEADRTKGTEGVIALMLAYMFGVQLMILDTVIMGNREDESGNTP